MSLDSSILRFMFLLVVLGGLTAYCGQPLIHDNEQAINIAATVFSILAGFLIAIIAIVGDPVLLPPGTWRAAEMERDKLNNRLIQYKWLFIIYLLTLILIFLAYLFKDKSPCLVLLFEYSFLFFGVIGFVLSLLLPEALMIVQRERIDAVIEHRMKEDAKNEDAK